MARQRNVLAAVDLGSNSFHMVVARENGGQLVIIDRIREMVRLGEGLAPDGSLDPKVSARALACLERFGHRLLAHARQLRARGRDQRAATRSAQGRVPRQGEQGDRPPDRGDLRPRGSPAYLFRRGPHAAAQPGEPPRGGHRRRQHGADHRARPSAVRARKPQARLRHGEHGSFRRRQAHLRALRTRPTRGPAGDRADPAGLPATWLGLRRGQFGHGPRPVRGVAGTGSPTDPPSRAKDWTS